MIFVTGSGFGLYGHAAALLNMGKPVATLERYRASIESREDLRDLSRKLTFFDDEATGIERADVLVLARRPLDNARAASKLAELRWPGTLVIEKPIAESALAAQELAGALHDRQRPWAVPYLFLHCDWYRELERAFCSGKPVSARIDWQFEPSQSAAAWKRSSAEGGGPLAFYFVHCLAVAEALLPGGEGHSTKSCQGGGEATRLELCSRSQDSSLITSFELGRPRFAVSCNNRSIVESDSPFGAVPVRNAVDPRIEVLQRFYARTVFGAEPQTAHFHERVHRAWRAFDAVATTAVS